MNLNAYFLLPSHPTFASITVNTSSGLLWLLGLLQLLAHTQVRRHIGADVCALAMHDEGVFRPLSAMGDWAGSDTPSLCAYSFVLASPPSRELVLPRSHKDGHSLNPGSLFWLYVVNW